MVRICGVIVDLHIIYTTVNAVWYSTASPLLVFNSTRFTTGNSGKTAHPRITTPYFVHIVAIMWNQTKVRTVLIFNANYLPTFFSHGKCD